LLCTAITMQALDHTANVYLAVSLSSSSPYLQNPSELSSAHPSVTHVGQVGQMSDVQLFSIPKDGSQHDILELLNAQEGVTRVDVQDVKRRTKRGGDEL